MRLERCDNIGVLYIDTDNNNAINFDFITESHQWMDEIEQDSGLDALVVTASHKTLFSPGVDLVTVMGYPREELRRFYEETTALIRRKFLFPKPEVYALNGHTIAGGLMMAATGDFRLMANGPYRLGLMEIDLGLAAFIGVVEMFKYLFGGRGAERLLLEGAVYSPQEALGIGLVDEVVEPDELLERAIAVASRLGSKPGAGYHRLKRFLRGATAERMRELDEAHFDELLEQWFDDDTQARLQAQVDRLKGPKTIPPS